jgi:leucyl aminopeptidase
MKKILFLLMIFACMQLSAQQNKLIVTDKMHRNSIDTEMNTFLEEINSDSIKATIQWLQNYGTRFLKDTNHRSIAVWLQQKFISIGYQNTVLDSFLHITQFNNPGFYTEDTTWQYNVIATLEGSVYPDSICIAGGHYDSMSDSAYYGKAAPGADDDASGVAAAIEVARVFKKINLRPALTIKFIAFAAEEFMGFTRSGAAYYAARADSLGEKIKFFANNDMIAYEPSANNWHADFYCFIGMDWMKNMAVSACTKYTDIIPNIINQNCPGDAFPFFERGFQTLHFFEDIFNPYYHTRNDVVEKLNMPYCAEMTKITMAMLIGEAHAVVGINEPIADLYSSLNIYPNPASNSMYIQNEQNI